VPEGAQREQAGKMQPSETLGEDDLSQLEADYAPVPVPPCRVCGEPLKCVDTGAPWRGVTASYACSSEAADFMERFGPPRAEAMAHFQASCWDEPVGRTPGYWPWRLRSALCGLVNRSSPPRAWMRAPGCRCLPRERTRPGARAPMPARRIRSGN